MDALDEERRLIRKIQKTGNTQATETLIRKYYKEIYFYTYKQVTDKHTAMDLTQNIFVSCLQCLSQYDRKKAGFRTWLYRIATNKIIDYHRSRSVERNIVLDVDVAEFPEEEEFTRQVEINDLYLRLQQYVNSLDVTTQHIFRLKFFGDCTFARIGELLSMPESTVKSKYYRLLAMLRKEFEDEYR